MRLKRLELVGFKTFADATELVFDQNITAIVGPNGSGKSNCADALLWVLAERRLSALRASEGTDVIFAGSERRRPLGLAEVTLTIDNSDHTLPVDFGEVSVTRRVHRNGESDYLLNGRRCRRKDVVDLFLDTGVGRQSFSVISQREIDAILSLEPEDRRRLVEEVAGVERYRSRRDETMRRLDDTAANLTRLGDIMLGLEMQVEPLAEQREQAQRYHELRQRAESLRLSLLVKDYQLLERRLLRSDEELAQYQERIVAAETALREAEAKEQQARLDLLQSDEALTTARAELGESSSRTETVGTAIRLAEERLSNLTARRQDAAEARQRHGDVAARAEAEAQAAEREAAEQQAALTHRQDELQALEAALRARRGSQAAAEAALASLRREASEVGNKLAAHEHARRSAEQALALAVERRDSLASRQAAAEQAVAAASRRAEEAAEAVEQAVAAQAEQRALQQTASEALASLERRRAALRDRIAERQASLGERQARLQVLRHAADSYEGLYAGVKAVLRARDRGRLRGDYAVVADILNVAEGCDVAIEAALGPRLQDLVCDCGEDARAAIEFLKQDRSGRATFLPLDMIEAGQGPRDLGRLRAFPGVVGWALDLVTTAPEYDLARRHLLAGVVVVEEIEAGIELRRAGYNRVTIVTLDGDLIRTSGAMTGGSREQRGPTLLTRRREIEALEREAQVLESELRGARGEEAEGITERHRLQAELTNANQAQETARRRVGEAERARLEARGSLGQAQAEQSRLTESAEQLGEDAHRATAARQAAEEALEALGRQREALAQQLTAAEEQATAARADGAAEADDLAARKVAVARLESRIQSLAQSAAGRRREGQTAADELARIARADTVWERESAAIETELHGLRAEWNEQRAVREERGEAVTALLAMRKDAAQAVDEAVAAARTARQQAAEAQESRHRAELRRTTVDADLNHLRQTLAEDHDGLTIERARQTAAEIANRQEAADELQSLREATEQLGEVNLGAIDEYERVTERLRFYERQKSDLEQARTDLLQVVAEIDALSEARLAEAFVAVNREFGALFRRVFGDDGEAVLTWTTPERILDSGIEVMVRLPGKRTQNIMLLSGGERAMTTITLLLAMFKVKPSPFCLVDELDAPLDAANLRKYVELLREFSAQSQFIVITHNPETTRAADVLYGITMPEPGVSRAYSHRPPVDEELGRSAVLSAAG